MSIAYGIDILPENDPYVKMAETAASNINAAGVPGAFFVDFLPICAFSHFTCLTMALVAYTFPVKYVPYWVPGAGFQRTAQAWRKNTYATRDNPYIALKEAVVSSFVLEVLS